MHAPCNAVVTPLHKAASYEPRLAILGIWGDTWLTRGKYGISVVVTGSTWRLLEMSKCCVSYVAVMRIPSLVLRNTWHYVIMCYSYGELPKFILSTLLIRGGFKYAKVWPRHYWRTFLQGLDSHKNDRQCYNSMLFVCFFCCIITNFKLFNRSLIHCPCANECNITF